MRRIDFQNYDILYFIVNCFNKELVAQGEKLNRINEGQDDVNNTLTATQKDLNKVKSVFGGLKNKFLRNSHKVDTKPGKNAPKTDSGKNFFLLLRKTFFCFDMQEQPEVEFARITGSDREVELNKNLEEMSKGLSHLKSLGEGMSFELDRQKPVIVGIESKAYSIKGRINDQNEQMKDILT